VWDARGANGRKDWRAQGASDAEANFTAVLAGASDADLAAVASADISAQWANANLSERTVYGRPADDRPRRLPAAGSPRRRGAAAGPELRPRRSTAGGATTGTAGTAAAPAIIVQQRVNGVTETALRVSRLSLAGRVSLSRLRLRGLQASMRLDPATPVLRLSVTGRVTAAGAAARCSSRIASCAPAACTAWRCATAASCSGCARASTSSRPAGRSAATLGPVARVVFRVAR
jgi:hypothetical protein